MLLLIIVMAKCQPNQHLMKSAIKFIEYETAKVAKGREIYFDCKNNLSLLAFLKLCHHCHKISLTLDKKFPDSAKLLSLQILLCQTYKYQIQASNSYITKSQL